MKAWTIRLAALLLAAALFPACSSGGSGGGPSVVNAVVQGTHFLIFFFGENATGDTDGSTTGTVVMDGAGSATIAATQNIDGAISALNTVAPYSAFSNGALRLSPVGLTLTGGYDMTTDLSVMASTASGDTPVFSMTVRQNGTTLGLGSMNGVYFMVGYSVDPVNPDHRSETGTATFDGAGNVNAVTVDNTEGTISAGGGAATYTMAADGAMTLTTPGSTYAGGLLDGGNIAILGTTTGDPAILIFVKQVAGAHSNADLTGSYWIATIGYKPLSNIHDVEIGSGSFNGAGNVTVSLTDNEEGVVSGGGGGAATYSVAADGTLQVLTGDTFDGGVLLGGQIAIAATTNALSDPEIIIAIKK